MPSLEKTPLQAPQDLQRRLALRCAVALGIAGVPLGLVGCGGGGDLATTDGVKLPLGIDSGGTGRMMSVFVSAPVSSTLPLTVGGTQFDTQASLAVDANGKALALGDVLPGMTCQILAVRPAGSSSASAQAQSIKVAEQLLAPVDAVNVAGKTLTALGQLVAVTSTTVFDAALSAGLPAVQAGQVLQVWGQLDVAGGRIVATRVALAPAGSDLAVRGVVSAIDRTSGRAALGLLQLRFAADDTSLVDPAVGLGSVVRVRLLAGAAGLDLPLLAMQQDALQLPDQVEAEIEGHITRVDSVGRFAVDGVDVDAAASAWALGAAPLALGQHVAVQGRSANGLLVASKVEADALEWVELEGSITAADRAAQTFVLKGITVSWSDSTRFEGGTAKLLAARRHAAVLGRWTADRTQLVAARIHVEA